MPGQRALHYSESIFPDPQPGERPLREIRTLRQARQAVDDGQPAQRALTGLRVWKNRLGIMQGALARHDRASLDRLLEQAARVDGSIKGFDSGRPWDNLETLVLSLATGR